MELFSPEWLAALLAIIVVDLLLAGDNAIVIALAARNLPPLWQKRAIIYGTAGAIAVRIVLIFFLSKLLLLPGLGIVGGLVLYFIAWRLLKPPAEDEAKESAASSFWAAMGTIIVADTAMGLDNVLAIAGAARGDFYLIIFGLALSVPIMMGGSVIILKVLKKAPWILLAGAVLLAGIAGRIILDDVWLTKKIDWTPLVEWTVVIVTALLVIPIHLIAQKIGKKPD